MVVRCIDGSMPGILNVDVVDYQETRDIHQTLDIDGRVVGLRPIEGSDRAFLHLRLPNGVVVRAQVSHQDFEAHVYSALCPVDNIEPLVLEVARPSPTAWARLRD